VLIKLGEGAFVPGTYYTTEEDLRMQAGLRGLTWHGLRRTFAGNLLGNGNDLVPVQKPMGHASPTTTAAYDRRGEEVKRRASRSLHVPFVSGEHQA
jgi:integrase